MRIDSEQLPQQLERKLAPLYTVHGAEPLLALEAADRIRAAARRDGFAERSVLTAESGFKWNELLFAGRSQSLFAAKQIVELRVPGGKLGTEGAAALQAYCESLSADVLSIVSLPRLDRAQQASAWFEALDRHGVVVEAQQVTRDRLPRWLQGRLRVQGQQADEATLAFLADRVEGNLLAAYQEVQKLALLFPAGPLDLAHVRNTVLDVARFDLFRLVEALTSQDLGRYARSLRGLQKEGEGAPLVLWALTEELRALLRVKSGLARGVPMAQLLRDNRIWGPRQRTVELAARRLDSARLEAALEAAAHCDRMIKGVAAGDTWQALLDLGQRVQGRKPLSEGYSLTG